MLHFYSKHREKFDMIYIIMVILMCLYIVLHFGRTEPVLLLLMISITNTHFYRKDTKADYIDLINVLLQINMIVLLLTHLFIK